MFDLNILISLNADISEDIPPLESSLIRIDALRVYTGGVMIRYTTANADAKISEIKNHYHLVKAHRPIS